MSSRHRLPREGIDWLGTVLMAALMVALVVLTMR